LLFTVLSWACQDLADAVLTELTTVIYMLCCLSTVVEAVWLERL